MSDENNWFAQLIQQGQDLQTQQMLTYKEIYEFIDGLSENDVNTLATLLLYIGSSSSPASIAAYWRGIVSGAAWKNHGVKPWGEDLVSDEELRNIADGT